MPIYLSQGANPEKFVTPQECRTKTVDGKELYVLSGVAIIDAIGKPVNSGKWRREELIISPNVTHHSGKELKIEQSAVLITLNAIGNINHAVDAGWAIDSCRVKDPRAIGGVSLRADIAVRDIDGVLYRVGYYATLIGIIEDAPTLY